MSQYASNSNSNSNRNSNRHGYVSKERLDEIRREAIRRLVESRREEMEQTASINIASLDDIIPEIDTKCLDGLFKPIDSETGMPT